MAQPEAAQAGQTPKPKAKKSGMKPDIATVAGIVLALAGILGGLILEKGQIQDIVQGTAAMIVLGGTFGAVLITNPLPVVLRAFGGLSKVFMERASSTPETIEALIQYATKARKNGIVSLEAEAAAIADPFLRKALGLAVDGTDLQEIRKMMETDIVLAEQANRVRSEGLGGRRRVRADGRNHRRRARADPGDEAPGGHQGSRPRDRGGVRRDGIWRRARRTFCFFPWRTRFGRACALPACCRR